MDTLWQDIKFGVRMLAKKPGFTAIAVLTLALGIGPNTAIFSQVDALLLKPLPFAHPDQLVRVYETRKAQGMAQNVVSDGEFDTWRAEAKSFAALTSVDAPGFNLTGAGEPEAVNGMRVVGDFFGVLGAPPMLGRTFSADEVRSGARVAVVSYDLWQRHFGGDRGVVGKTITLDASNYTIVGVMPRHFVFDEEGPEDVWVPRALAPDEGSFWDNHFSDVFGRLKQGVTLAQANAEMTGIAARIEKDRPATNTGHGAHVTQMSEDLVGELRPAMLALMGTVGFVLLIACANVANLSLARATSRRKEQAIRTALGATPGRLVRQGLTESMLVAVSGGALGLIVGSWCTNWLAGTTQTILPQANPISVNGDVLAFTAGVTLLTGLLFGLAPALQAATVSLVGTLKEGGRSSSAGGGSRRMAALVIGEIALAIVVVVGAGLTLRSFDRVREVNAGLDPHGVLTATVSVTGQMYASPERQAAFIQDSVARVRALPGVRSAAAVDLLPFSGNNASSTITLEGRPPAPLGSRPHADRDLITPDYFRTMGIPMLRGRDFTDADTATAERVVIVNQALAHSYYPGEDPLGKRFHIGSPESTKVAWMTIVGIVGDIHRRTLEIAPRPEMYIPFLQFPGGYATILARTDRDASLLGPALRAAIHAEDPNMPIASMLTMDAVMAATYQSRWLTLLLFGGFAFLALVLAAVGTYGVMSYTISQRIHEIGVRMALGAQPSDVLKLVIGSGMKLALAGIAAGTLVSLGVTQMMSTFLFGVTPTDPATFAGVVGILAAVALAACWIPAHRATRVDPLVALRYE